MFLCCVFYSEVVKPAWINRHKLTSDHSSPGNGVFETDTVNNQIDFSEANDVEMIYSHAVVNKRLIW